MPKPKVYEIVVGDPLMQHDLDSITCVLETAGLEIMESTPLEPLDEVRVIEFSTLVPHGPILPAASPPLEEPWTWWEIILLGLIGVVVIGGGIAASLTFIMLLTR